MSKKIYLVPWIVISLFFMMFLYLTSCTYSINMVHTQGNAEDVIDEEQKSDADIAPNLELPISSL